MKGMDRSMKRNAFLRLLAALYAAAVLGWLICAAVSAGRAGSCTERRLSVADAELEALIEPTPGRNEWALYADGALITTDTDAGLSWTVDGMVTGLRMQLRSSQPVSGSELFYTTAAGQEISDDRRLTPLHCDTENGVYEFRFARPTYVYRLRLDPTEAGGAFLQLREILLDPQRGAAAWLLPDAAQLSALLLAPALAALAVRECVMFCCGTQQTKK